MNKEENNNHILIEVLNNDGDLKLIKFRNPQAIWQNNDYPDEYVFRDVDYVNIFQLIRESKQLKENWNKLREYFKFEIEFDKRWYISESKEYTMQKHFPDDTIDGFSYALEKMQELESGDSNE